MKHFYAFRTWVASLIMVVLTTGIAFADMKLVMVEEDGCMWCARWNAEIADIYPKTTEGKAAPLLRMDIKEREPEGLTFARGLHFTPTFVLMLDGQEVGRIEGYPGEDFFWGLLGQMIERAQPGDAAG